MHLKLESSCRKKRAEMKTLEDYHKIYLPDSVKNKRKLLRNAVYPELGLHIYKAATKQTKQEVIL